MSDIQKRIQAAIDRYSRFEESKHLRSDDGKFASEDQAKDSHHIGESIRKMMRDVSNPGYVKSPKHFQLLKGKFDKLLQASGMSDDLRDSANATFHRAAKAAYYKAKEAKDNETPENEDVQ